MKHSHYWHLFHRDEDPKPPFNWGIVIAVLVMIAIIILGGQIK